MKKVLKSVLTVTFIGVVTRIAGFVFKIILSRKLGAEGIGRLQICLTFLGTLFCLSSGGIPVTVSRKTAVFQNDKKSSGEYLSAALLTGGGIALLITIVLFLLSKKLTFIFTEQKNVKVFLFLLPSLFAGTVYSVIRGWFWGREKYNVFSLTEMSEELVRIVLAVVVFSLVAFSDKLVAIALSFTIADYVSMLLLTVVFFAVGGRLYRPKYFKELLYHSAPVTGERMLGALISTLVAFVFPKLLTRFYPSSQATADYGRITAMAATFIFAPSTVTGALSTVLVPKIAVLIEKNPESAKKTVDYALSGCVIISGFFAALYMALGKSVTELFYGDVRAGEYLSFCAAVVLPLTLNGIMGSVINSIGKEKNGFLNFAVGNILFVVITFLLVGSIGWYSYAVGQFVGSCAVFVLNCRLLKKENVSDFSFFKTLFFTVLAVAVSSITVSFINVYLWTYSFKYLALIINVVILTVLYLFILIITGSIKISLIKNKIISKILPKISTTSKT